MTTNDAISVLLIFIAITPCVVGVGQKLGTTRVVDRHDIALQILLEQEVIVGVGRVCVGAVHHAYGRTGVIVQVDQHMLCAALLPVFCYDICLCSGTVFSIPYFRNPVKFVVHIFTMVSFPPVFPLCILYVQPEDSFNVISNIPTPVFSLWESKRGLGIQFIDN